MKLSHDDCTCLIFQPFNYLYFQNGCISNSELKKRLFMKREENSRTFTTDPWKWNCSAHFTITSSSSIRGKSQTPILINRIFHHSFDCQIARLCEQLLFVGVRMSYVIGCWLFGQTNSAGSCSSNTSCDQIKWRKNELALTMTTMTETSYGYKIEIVDSPVEPKYYDNLRHLLSRFIPIRSRWGTWYKVIW